LLLLGSQIAPPLYSQPISFQREVEAFPVVRYTGLSYSLPFIGGLNRPIQQFVDIDGDGDQDLFVRDSDTYLKFFENQGGSATARFRWVTDAFQGLDTGTWFRFVDADGDGDADLFADSPLSGIRYYRNAGTPGTAAFSVAVDTLRDTAGEPVFVEVPTIPDWTDMDYDGDPDLFLGRLSGEITHYAHDGLDQDSLPLFAHVTDSYQGLLIVTGGDDCFLTEINPPSRRLHGSNAMTFVDVDGDLDAELFWGDFYAQSLLYFENSGTCESPAIALTLEQYPDGNPVCTGGFNVPSFVDINDDGDLDLFVGTQGGAYSLTRDLADNFAYMENTGGGPGQQQFVLRSRRFLDAIDTGDKSIPAVADIDGDGDPDFLLANEAEPLEDQSSRLHFFRNDGTLTAPVLSHADTHYLALEIGYNYAPAFVDIDADGDQDIVMGEWAGGLNLLRNDGTPAGPQFVLVDEAFAGIDIGNNSVPQFADIDNDGDEDLFVGEFLGNINFYRNTGTAQSGLFVLDTTDYFGIDVGLYSSVWFADLDHDKDFDLLVGSDDQGLLLYRNTGTADTPLFVADTTVAFPFHKRLVPVMADMDGDTDADLIAGVEGGGMVFYRNQEIISSLNETNPPLPDSPVLLNASCYPNPFNPATTISFELGQAAHVRVQVVETTGRIVGDILNEKLRKGRHEVRWNAGRVASGVYFCKIWAGESFVVLKLLSLH
jgi:hypothetical protein